MPGAFIVLGDKTSHGGTVLEASQQSDSGGKPIARMGDKVSCPKCGNNAIASGDQTLVVDGKAVARHGDKTACGATLIAGQQNTTDAV
ncbi:PAAR domain-containing protein [Pseudoduganella sp. DS3]|uniref:PAAR domain-containing protein n=1 Tax=Pseudoduganella guangdongensis TaxID=2692179 RepID=A0A6N9HP91_9BURK|nr:PAAR domain-containing protein [Pseudoduganella guangdongensis]MYN04495.1 PAAR domain-containing protein [Pseudoduganella guangdongensis]